MWPHEARSLDLRRLYTIQTYRSSNSNQNPAIQFLKRPQPVDSSVCPLQESSQPIAHRATTSLRPENLCTVVEGVPVEMRAFQPEFEAWSNHTEQPPQPCRRTPPTYLRGASDGMNNGSRPFQQGSNILYFYLQLIIFRLGHTIGYDPTSRMQIKFGTVVIQGANR